MPPLSATELELAFVDRFLWSKGLEAYPVQERAIAEIIGGKSVLVSVPTGTGKTIMAKAAIYAAMERGQTAIYTTPLRALTEEKFRELSDDFGAGYVGMATGDFKVNREAPIQVEVAEILWNRIVGEKNVAPADVVIMDEGHYFNDNERGYVWEQSIIGLDPRSQLVVLSATVGHPERFCHWVELTRRQPMVLVESRDRKVPLVHEYKEEFLIDVVRGLAHAGEVPAVIFVFGRELCFEVARLLKSCRRFTTDEERAQIELACDEALLPAGCSKELRPLLTHGIGIHHAGILPRYKQLVEQLTLERLVKFVVCTETIAAGINLPAKTVVFPSLRKYIQKQPRLVTAAEYHQMSGRAGRPQFDDRGLAITLAPEDVVSDLKKELKQAGKRPGMDEAKIRKSIYNRYRSDAQRKGEVTWSPEAHAELVGGEPADLRSKTKITAEQVLALGLPDLPATVLPGMPLIASVAAAAPVDGEEAPAPVAAPAVPVAPARPTAAEVEASLPPSMRLDVVTVIDNLLLDDRDKRGHHKLLAQLVANMRALGVIDEHGEQVAGHMIRELQGVDGLFVYYVLFNEQLDYVDMRALLELLVDHDVIQRKLDRKIDDARREWCRTRMRELRMDNPQVAWEDVEAEWDKAHPRELSKLELVHQRFSSLVPHPELHGGKKQKNVWALMEDNSYGFLDLVEREGLEHEEGSLFTYLIRVMNFANKLADASKLETFTEIAEKIKAVLGQVDPRLS